MAPVLPRRDAGSFNDPSDESHTDSGPQPPISSRRIRQTPSFTLDLDIHQEDIITPTPNHPIPNRSTMGSMLSTNDTYVPQPSPTLPSSSQPAVMTSTIPEHTSLYVSQQSSSSSPTSYTNPTFPPASPLSSASIVASSSPVLHQPTPIPASSSSSSPYPPTSTAPSRYVRPALASPPPVASTSVPSSPSSSSSSASPTTTAKTSNPYSSHYSHSQQRRTSESSLSSRRSSGSTEGGTRPAFTLDLSSAAVSGTVAGNPDSSPQSFYVAASGSDYVSGSGSGSGSGSVFLDTPMPGQKEVDEAKASASYNYFSSNRVGVESGGGDSSAEGEGSGVQDMFFEDEGLGYLEKIYLFARSKAVFHRVFIARALPEYLAHVSPAEAVEYVLPLLNGLGTDQDESVREAFVAELVPVMWWFFVNCELIEVLEEEQEGEGDEGEAYDADLETVVPQSSTSSYHTASGSENTPTSPIADDADSDRVRPKLLISTFTPLLGSLLLSQNALVGEVARNCIIELLRRVVTNASDVQGGPLNDELERAMLERELIEGVIIALARLGQNIEELEGDEMAGFEEGDAGAYDEELEASTFDLSAPSIEPAVSPESSRSPPTHIDIPPEISTSSPTTSPLTNRPIHGAASPSASLTSPIAFGSISAPATQSVTSPGASIHSTSTNRSTPSLSSTTGTSASSESEYSLHSSSSPSSAGDHVVVRNPFDDAAERQLAFQGDQQTLRNVDSSELEGMFELMSPGASPSASSSSSASGGTITGSLADIASAEDIRIPSQRGRSMPEGRSVAPAWDDGGITPKIEKETMFSSPIANSTPSQAHLPSASSSSLSRISSSTGPTQTQASPASSAAPSPANTLLEEEDATTPSAVMPSDSSPTTTVSSLSSGTISPTPTPSTAAEPTTADAAVPASDDPLKEEAAVGCVASMSLMAAVAASGHIPEDAKGMFVAEVARVGTDPIFWVRREAAYALGALAKVVDEEMLLDYLVPLYQSFLDDSAWQVRQSVLFALPPILARLSPEEKQQFALENYQRLTRDKSRSVRCAMLEVLGEVIYTFANDPDGPPHELLNIFIGNPPDGYRLDPPPPPVPVAPVSSVPGRLAQSAPSTPGVRERPKSKRGLLARDPSAQPMLPPPDPETSGIDPVPDLDRPLICSFNFPAVALTVGPKRWHEVSSYYLKLARDYASKSSSFGSGEDLGITSQHQRQQNQKKLGRVRRTLAASLGEMARILGPDIARDDLLPIFWEALHATATPFAPVTYGFMGSSFATVSAVGAAAHNLGAEAEAEDARTKMLECLILFVTHLAPRERELVAKGLEEAWREHVRGWREREVFARTFGGLCVPFAQTESGGEAMRALIMLGLTDNVAAVRDEVIAQLPTCFEGLKIDSPIAKRLRADILELSRSSSFRRRATFVKCEQSLVLSPTWGSQELSQTAMWDALQTLASDTITDVRIGTARLASLIAYQHYPSRNYPPKLMTLIRTLRDDPTPEVSSFVRFLIVNMPQPMVLPVFQPHVVSPFATFSNPPFFGEVFSPSAGTEGAHVIEEAPPLSSQGNDSTALPTDLPNLSDSDEALASGSVTPQPPSGEDPVPPRIDRPPIYRVWSY